MAYTDEMRPGNMLNSSTRKSWCIYMSFLEMGRLLSKCDAWFCLAVTRSAEVASLAAGMSQMVRLVLESIFADGRAETGLLLTSPQGNVRLHFGLHMVLQDGAAHKALGLQTRHRFETMSTVVQCKIDSQQCCETHFFVLF